METYTDSDNNDLAKVMDGDEDQDIQSDTEHAAGQVDSEGDEEVGVVPGNGQAHTVSGVDEGLNSCLL